MSQDLMIEIPEADFRQWSILFDEWLELMSRIEAERPTREAEDAQHNHQFREKMDAIWARIEHVEKIH